MGRARWAFAGVWREPYLQIALLLLGIATRFPFRSQMLYHWDSVNFALAMQQFDVRLHQPQPPGYFLYVMLAKLVDTIVVNPNSSLTLVSVAFAALTVPVFFELGRTMFGKQAALISTMAFLTSPLFWFHGEVALSRSAEACIVTLLGLCCYKLITGKGQWLIPSAVVLALEGGFRPQSLVLLAPLWIFAVSKHSFRRLPIPIMLVCLITVVWLVPTLALSGGAAAYLEANRGTAGDVFIEMSPLSGPRFLLNNLGRLTGYTLYALMFGVFPLSAYAIWLFRREGRRLRSDPRVQLLLLWILPALLQNVVSVQQPGQTFAYMPAIVLLAGPAVWQVGKTLFDWGSRSSLIARVGAGWMHWIWGTAPWPVLGLTTVIVVVNVGFFFGAPSELFGMKRMLTSTPSWSAIQSRDQFLSDRIDYIRSHFPAGTTVIVASGTSFRHPDYYLPDYFHLRFPEVGNSITPVLDFASLPSQIETMVLFDASPEDFEYGGLPMLDRVEFPDGGYLWYTKLRRT